MLGWLPLSPREHYVWPALEDHPDPPFTDGLGRGCDGGCDARTAARGLRWPGTTWTRPVPRTPLAGLFTTSTYLPPLDFGGVLSTWISEPVPIVLSV